MRVEVEDELRLDGVWGEVDERELERGWEVRREGPVHGYKGYT
jgi:hypothetical protein